MIEKFKELKLPYVFKSMKDVAGFMDRKYIDSTDSRKSILKELAQYCDFEKVKRKIVVNNIYDTVQAKEDGRTDNVGGNNSKYSEYVDDMILFWIYARHAIDETLTGWQDYLDMNGVKIYSIVESKESIKKVADSIGYHTDYVWDFFSVVRGMYNTQIKASYKRLEKKGLITVCKRTFIFDNDGECTEATDEQIEQISMIEFELLQEMNCKNLQTCINFGRYIEYKEELDERLFDINVLRKFDKYEVCQVMGKNFNDNVNIYSLEGFQEISHRLNNKFCVSIVENARKRQEKARQEILNEAMAWGGITPVGMVDTKKSAKMKASHEYDYALFYNLMVDKYIRIASSEQLKSDIVKEDYSDPFD
ncbi:hypothetical protein [Cohnella sp. WQ 127256]|uniref:hypothetical protein n=1 Tax=Cohnella sp. WQ 127256 TaxID=2938790 RepID=UPI002118F5CD|nr:hypothetical protein [Cohnella sp. WQ 127256]